jgi:hypothetical protein
MKYAVLGPQRRINRIADTEPQHVAEGRAVAQLTDEQAATVLAGRQESPPAFFFLTEADELQTAEEHRAAVLVARPRPLRTRLLAIVAAQSAATKAAFAPVLSGVDWLIQQGEIEAAQTAIAGVEVPQELEPVKAALLAEFN